MFEISAVPEECERQRAVRKGDSPETKIMQIHFNNIKERDEILDQVSAFKHIYLRPPIEMEKCKTNDNERSAVLLC